jgi:L-alanine-DL-glutamate epimerase-like enolase superfamily enzyme
VDDDVQVAVRPALGADLYASDYRDGLDAIDGNGCVPVPEGPGLGVTYNWDLIERQRTGYTEYR